MLFLHCAHSFRGSVSGRGERYGFTYVSNRHIISSALERVHILQETVRRAKWTQCPNIFSLDVNTDEIKRPIREDLSQKLVKFEGTSFHIGLQHVVSSCVWEWISAVAGNGEKR